MDFISMIILNLIFLRRRENFLNSRGKITSPGIPYLITEARNLVNCWCVPAFDCFYIPVRRLLSSNKTKLTSFRTQNVVSCHGLIYFITYFSLIYCRSVIWLSVPVFACSKSVPRIQILITPYINMHVLNKIILKLQN